MKYDIEYDSSSYLWKYLPLFFSILTFNFHRKLSKLFVLASGKQYVDH